MKQIKFLIAALLLVSAAFTATAQVHVTNVQQLVGKGFTATTTTHSDTLTNADTTVFSGISPAGKDNVNFIVQWHQISGTTVGSLKLYGSATGAVYTQNAIDSVTLTNGTNGQKQVWRLPQSYRHYNYYKLILITSGTVSGWNKTYVYSPR